MATTLTGRQKIMRKVYPVLMKLTQWLGKNAKVLHNDKKTPPAEALHQLAVTLNNGQAWPLQQWQGKKLLLVNTASNCGYTAQYAELQQLQDKYKDRLVVVGFPANDFKEQEKDDDNAIAEFCQVNFGVQFPIVKKSSVVKGANQHPVFAWLSQANKNGWNNQAPSWNFSKYLVDEKGVLLGYFDPSISPLHPEIIKQIEQ